MDSRLFDLCNTPYWAKRPLTPIPVSGAFDRIGVDVVQFPRTSRRNRYAVVFVDYLTKWPEVYAVPDQSSATVARLLVEEVVSRHGVPGEILSDRGRTFLSGLMKEMETLLGYEYHRLPPTDGWISRKVQPYSDGNAGQDSP